MAVSITNFNQMARDQQMQMLERMRALCPQTAALGQNLAVRPLNPGELPPSLPATGNSLMLSPRDQLMFETDVRQAQAQQGLTALLGQACAQEMITGEGATLPPFLQLP